MKKLTMLALALALIAAPAAMAGESCCAKGKGGDKDKTHCVKVEGKEHKDCKPEDCKDKDKCTPEEKAKCAAAAEAAKKDKDSSKAAPKS
jgi:hypothetical protein